MLGDALQSSIEIEQALLGAILVDARSMDLVADIVRTEDFAEEVHRRTFEIMARLAADGRPITLHALRGFVGDLDLGGMSFGQYLAGLASGAPLGSAGATEYARLVRDTANRRRLAEIAETTIATVRANPYGVSAAQIASETIAALDGIASATAPGNLQRLSIGEAGRAALSDALERKAGKPSRALPTRLADLDRIIGGLGRGNCTVLAGRPSMGKTAVAIQLALNVASQGTGVFYVSLEMGGMPLGQRALASLAYDDFNSHPIAYTAIAKGLFSADEEDRLQRASEKLDALPLEIEPEPGLTVSQIAARVRKAKAKFEKRGIELGLVAVDHMGLVGASNRYAGNRVREIAEISNGLRNLGRELDLHMLMLSQLNRQAEGREDKRPQMSDLRESGDIEQDADLIVGVFRAAYYLQRSGSADDQNAAIDKANDLELCILKNRQGPTQNVTVHADMGSNAIRNRQRHG